MEAHRIQNGESRKVRSQPSLLWRVEGKRWKRWS